MSSAQSAARHIGRVGGLAIALGIGAAMASGTASAETSRGDAGSREQSSQTSSTADSPSASANRRTSTAPTRSTPRARAGASTSPKTRTVTTANNDVRVSAPAPAPAAAAPVAVPAILATQAAAAVPARNAAPAAPADSPASLALLSLARRDAARTGTRLAATQSALPGASTALVSTPSMPSSVPSAPLGWVTGQRNALFPGITWPQTNNTRWAEVYGTDLGIMWFNGDNGLTQLAFGDTFSAVNMTGSWRSNVLLLSDDTNLTDGLSLINTGPAYQFIPAARNQVFFIGSEVTNIPTAAIYANGENYVNYMSVKSWDSPGRWTTNYSAISQFDEGTNEWVLQKRTVRSAGWFRSSQMYRAGDQNFQQMAYVLEPESGVVPGETRYVYAFGTPAGRQGSAYLSRVSETAVTDLSQYEYWDGEKWVDRQAKAAPIIGDSTRSTGIFGWAKDIANNPMFFGGWFAGFTGAKTGGNVSEMSVQYNEYLDKYVVLYGNGANNVILRTADTPEGPWSDPVTLATSVQYPGLYAPMIHPLSGTGELTDSNGDPDITNLYWNMSIWSNYNVVLMQTDLSPLAITQV